MGEEEDHRRALAALNGLKREWREECLLERWGPRRDELLRAIREQERLVKALRNALMRSRTGAGDKTDTR